jgi:glycosyltransferase involved in cell wall biosynthesis
MRILIDGDYRSQARGTGITTYSRLLAESLARNFHEIRWLSGAHAGGEPDPLADTVSVADELNEARGPRAYFRTASRMAGGLLNGTFTARRLLPDVVMTRPGDLPLSTTLLAPDLFVHAHYRHMLLRKFSEVRVEEPIDVLHLTAPLPVRMRNVRTAVTIHDLVPIRLPYTTQDNKREFIDRVRMSVKLADLVLTVSESSRREVIDLLGTDPKKVFVTWQTSDIAPLTDDERPTLARTLARYGLEENGYVLFVGAIEPKKNVRRLVEAFFDAEEVMPLVLAGPRAWKWQQEVGGLNQTLGDNARKRLRLLGHVTNEDLRRLYAGARMLVVPSLYEGFGLTALEAMRMGCPVLASAVGGLREVCGDAALLVDPLDRQDMARKIAKLIGEERLRDDLRAAGQVQAARFSADAYDEQLREAYSLLA